MERSHAVMDSEGAFPTFFPASLPVSSSSIVSTNSSSTSNSKRFSSSTITASKQPHTPSQTTSSSSLERSIDSASCLTPPASRFTPSQPFNTPNSSFEFEQDENMQAIRDKLKSFRLHSPDGSSRSPSSLLQDMLRDRKAQSHRVTKTYGEKVRRRSGRDDSILDLTGGVQEKSAQSSPLASKNTKVAEVRESRRASGMSFSDATAAPRGMGVRELDEYMSKMSKQNFNLKLEIHHHRQRVAALEELLEKAELLKKEHAQLKKENSELHQVNEQLVFELEKRDAAVQEAVGIICELEAKVDQLEEELRTDSRPSTAQPDTDTFTTTTEPDQSSSPSTSPDGQTVEAPVTPARPHKKGSRQGLPKHKSSKRLDAMTPNQLKTPASLYRTPSFLTGGDKRSTGALRSLYLQGDNEYSFLTLSRRTSGMSIYGSPDQDDGMDSPRLSVLSESSFLSVYGDTRHVSIGAANDIREEKRADRATEESCDDNARDLNPGSENEVEPEVEPQLDIWRSADTKRASRRNSRAVRIEQWIDDRAATPCKPPRSQRREKPVLLVEEQKKEVVLPPTPDTMSAVEGKESESCLGSVIAEKSGADSWDLESLQVEQSEWDDEEEARLELERLAFFSPASPGVVRRLTRKNFAGLPRDLLFTPSSAPFGTTSLPAPPPAVDVTPTAARTPSVYHTPASTFRRSEPVSFYTPAASPQKSEPKGSRLPLSSLRAATPKVPGAWAESPVKKGGGLRSRLFRRG